MKIKDFLHERQLKKFEKKAKEYKPLLISKFREQAEESIRNEYEDTLEIERNRAYAAENSLKELIDELVTIKSKYENLVELHEQLLAKVEKANTDKGILKNEVKHLKSEIKDLQTDETQ